MKNDAPLCLNRCGHTGLSLHLFYSFVVRDIWLCCTKKKKKKKVKEKLSLFEFVLNLSGKRGAHLHLKPVVVPVGVK